MLVPLMNDQDRVGLDFDEGIYEYIYKMTNSRRDSARIDEDAANRTKDRCGRHKRKLQAELAKAGILRQPGQKYSGDDNRARMIAPFSPDEIRLGALLGTGGFSTVFEIDSFIPDQSSLSIQITAHEEEARDHLVKNVKRTIDEDEDISNILQKKKKKNKKKGPPQEIARYSLKHLRRGLTKEPERFERAAIDLVLEAQLLLAMDHPNIVSLRGWSAEGPEGYKDGRHTGFFIIIDRLPETLEDRIFAWRASSRKYKNRLKLPWGRKKYCSKLDFVICERLQVAHDIAAAIEYMHDRRIINRDLKASNIGFDIHGEVKLFDFGLSRLLPAKKEKTEETFLMSRVGTKYYMAPEIRKKIPYGLSADVYSYGVVLWEILSISSPREALKKIKDEAKDASILRCPLPMCKCWNQDVANLLKACLSVSPIHRPPVAEVRYVLEHLTEHFMAELGMKRLRDDRQQRRSTLRIDLSLLMDNFTSQGSSECGESTMITESIGDQEFVSGVPSHDRRLGVLETSTLASDDYRERGTALECEVESEAERKEEISREDKGDETPDWTKSICQAVATDAVESSVIEEVKPES